MRYKGYGGQRCMKARGKEVKRERCEKRYM